MKPSDVLDAYKLGGVDGLLEAFGERKDKFMKGVPSAASQFDRLKQGIGEQVKINTGKDGDGANVLHPLKDMLEGVNHEDVVRHAETITDSISNVGLKDVSDMATKGQELLSKGWSGGLFAFANNALNQVADDARKKAIADGIDVDAEFAKLHEEL